MKHCFLLRARHGFAFGDVVLATSLARDIHLAYPGQYRLTVDTHFTPVWKNNPHVEPANYTKDHQRVDLAYNAGIASSKRGNRHHFLSWFHREFSEKTGLRVPVTLPKGDLHLDGEEEKPLIEGRYWIIMAGGKKDMTVKHWGKERYQELVDRLAPQGVRFVQCGAVHQNHVHQPLDNVLDALGKTEDLRRFFTLVKHCDGIVCGVTGAMHIAACFDKPCVVIAGGREEPWWEGYCNTFYPTAFGPDCAPVKVEHKFLHTVGLLDCCRSIGCWKARTVPIDPKDSLPGVRSLCELPLREPGREAVPTCMDMVTPAMAAQAVTDYYGEGTIAAPAGAALRWLRDVSAKPQTISHKTPPLEIVPKPRAAKVTVEPLPASMQHHAIKKGFTVCVLCYGPHTDLAKRCLDSLVKTMPLGLFDLRVGCNACPPETLSYVRSLPVTKVYASDENRLKYPVMRDMLWDSRCPVETDYVIWLDDDSFVVNPTWLDKLSAVISANHGSGCRLYGAEFVHDIARYKRTNHRPERWFQSADWHQGKPFWAGKNARFPAPNGSTIRFVAGGFFAIGMDAVRKGQIPDKRLKHNGGDIAIGEQVKQAGFKTCAFNTRKEYIHTSGALPRGESRVGSAKVFPWQQGV